jgi:hypothetical protein
MMGDIIVWMSKELAGEEVGRDPIFAASRGADSTACAAP